MYLMGNMELLCMQCRGIGPHLVARGILIVFLELRMAPGYILRLRQGSPFKTRVCSATSGLLSSYKGHLRNLLEAWQGNMDASRGKAGDPVSLSSCHRVIGLSISFQEVSGILTF